MTHQRWAFARNEPLSTGGGACHRQPRVTPRRVRVARTPAKRCFKQEFCQSFATAIGATTMVLRPARPRIARLDRAEANDLPINLGDEHARSFVLKGGREKLRQERFRVTPAGGADELDRLRICRTHPTTFLTRAGRSRRRAHCPLGRPSRPIPCPQVRGDSRACDAPTACNRSTSASTSLVTMSMCMRSRLCVASGTR